MFEKRIMAFLSGACQVPFHGLGFLVFAFFVLTYLIHPDHALFQGKFVDSDDAMHFVRVIEWLGGQSWFDPVVYRLSPPHGTMIHYSRLAELPLAFLMLPLHLLGMSWIKAAYVTSAFYPLALFLGCLASLRWLAEPVIGRDWSRGIAYATLFAYPLTFQFLPGRVDHHGLVAILITLALGALIRGARAPDRKLWPVMAATLLSFSLSIGFETLPWLLIFSGWIGLNLALKGRAFIQSVVLFALSLYFSSALLLALMVAPEAYYDLYPLAFSFVFVLLCGAIALVLLLTAGLSLFLGLKGRLVLGACLGMAAAVGFLQAFPALVVGPYGAMDQELGKLFFMYITEAKPLIASARSEIGLVATIFYPLLALCASIVFMDKCEHEKTWEWFLFVLLLLVGVILCLFYQQRVILQSYLFSLVPMTMAMKEGWEHISRRSKGISRILLSAGLVVLVGPFATIFMAATNDKQDPQKSGFLFPVQTGEAAQAGDVSVWQVLTDEKKYGDRPRLIMNAINEGSTILFQTKHRVLAAPYHTNVDGNLDALNFFRATDMDKAKEILRRRNVDLVFFPRVIPEIYVLSRSSEAAEKTESLARQLIDNKAPPWLVPVDVPLSGGIHLYEVRKDML